MTYAALYFTLAFTAAPPSEKQEIGSLVLDGLPPIPERILERTNQYNNIRGAAFLDWDPAGEGMLIATRFGETSQLHRVRLPGGDREQLTFYPEPVNLGLFDPAHAPQSGPRGFAFLMDRGGNEFYQLYWYDPDRGREVLLTDGKSRNEGLRTARAGGRFAFMSTLRNGKDFDLYLLEGIEPGKTKRLKELEGQWHVLDWSGDDQEILLRRFVSINESYLYVFHLASGVLTELDPRPGVQIAYGSAAFHPKNGGVYMTSDEGFDFQRLVYFERNKKKRHLLTADLRWDVTAIAVSPDGKLLAFNTNQGGKSVLHLAPTSAPERWRPFALPVGVVFGLKFDPQSRWLGFSLSAGDISSDAFAIDLRARKLVRWTKSELGGLNAARFASAELVEYESFDGRKIQAWYFRPKTESEAKKGHPVVISIHGGPEAQSMAGFSREAQVLVDQLGAAVLYPNVRGSSGYGKQFLLLDNGDKREDSVKDIGKLLDWIATRPELDSTRVAVSGGSYGGYMVLASMAAYSDRLRCGIELVGISNFVKFLENTEPYRRDLRRVEYGDERDPKMRAFLNSISPTGRVSDIKKPLFVAHGANDPRVPLSEAEQIVAGVRKAGGNLWYLLAKDEGHGFQKKKNRDFLLNASVLFFEEFLVKE